MIVMLLQTVFASDAVVVTPTPNDRDHLSAVGRRVGHEVRGSDQGVGVLGQARAWGSACAIPVEGEVLAALDALSATYDPVWVADPGGDGLWRFVPERGMLQGAGTTPLSSSAPSATVIVVGEQVPTAQRELLGDFVRQASLVDPHLGGHLTVALRACIGTLPAETMERVREKERPGEPLYIAYHPRPGALAIWRVDTEGDRLMRVW